MSRRISLVVVFYVFACAVASGAPITLRVRDTAGVARTREVVRSGIPLPRSLNVTGIDRLAVIDAAGAAVPAQFQILARWNAGRSDATAPVQWLLVFFPATVTTNGTATYRLVTDGSVANAAPAQPVRVTKTGNRVVVDTGAALFTIDADKPSLFEEVRIGETVIVSGGALTARVNARDATHAALRRLSIERNGPLAATVVVDGSYDWPAAGGGGLGSQRRYEFTAGSPTVLLRHAIAWEGDYCGKGDITCGGNLNAVKVQSVRDTLRFSLTGARDTLIAGGRDFPAVHTAASTASLRQRLRASRTEPPRYEIDPGVSGAKADGALLAVSGAEGTVAIALDHMQRYEPQALRLLAGNSLAIDLADDTAWLADRQGLFATMAITVIPGGASRALLETLTWAPLNHPLRAWPDATTFATSDAIDDVPAGTLPAAFASYDAAILRILQSTIDKTDELGVYGLMSWGLLPRTWADPIYSDEIDCFGADPTPDEHWDDLYWCTTWTDYHNAAFTAAMRAMRNGETEWLDELARPAALRQLHTQIEQCSPSDDFFYCGQAPAGYGGYRLDFNSSHAYFDNLQLYYFLTGDGAVVDTLQRGASTMRIYYCSRRPAAACTADDPPTDDYANLTGRVASQWNSVFRFVGLASADATYLDDYRMNLTRAVTQQYVAADRDNTRYGFLLGLRQPVTTPGTYTTDQVWLTALYDMKMLERLRRDTSDTAIGNPTVRPSEVITSFARTMARFGPTVAAGATGTVNGPWPNQLDFTWSGARIGGTLVSVRANGGGSDPLLYDSNKAPLAAPLASAAIFTGDPVLRSLAESLIHLAIDGSFSERAPLGKAEAEFTIRLHSALAKLFPPSNSEPRKRSVRR